MSKNICEHCCVNEDIPEETVARANEMRRDIRRKWQTNQEGE